MTADKNYTWYNTPEARKVSSVIRHTRTRRGMTPEELAKYLNVARSAVYRWESMRLPKATVTILNWLFEDEGQHSALYWRERATAAETAMRDITESVLQFRKDLAELEEGDSPRTMASSAVAQRLERDSNGRFVQQVTEPTR